MCDICTDTQQIINSAAFQLPKHLLEVPKSLLKHKKIKGFVKQCILDQVFINVGRVMSVLSHCVSRQVACVIAKEGRIIATGINGTTQGDVNCDEIFPKVGFNPVEHRKWADVNEIHGEMNAINWAAKYGLELDGATLYCTLQPCNECSKNIPAVGIKRIVFDTFYDRVDNFEAQRVYLERKGVIIEKLPDVEEFNRQLQKLIDKIKKKSKSKTKKG